MEKQFDYIGYSEDKSIQKYLDADEKILFCDKVFKFNPLDWKQERNFILTSKHIFNLKKKNLKRKIPLKNVGAVTKSVDPVSSEFVIHVPAEYDYRYASERREQIITILKETHVKIFQKNLPVYGVNHRFLKDFTTTKSDAKKSKFKIPEEFFRLKEEDLVTNDNDLFDNFDLMEGKKKKSKTLYQKEGKGGKLVTLEDFKIMKVIGQGSFGKVFLVEKKNSDGELYAMKVLRKDVIIDSDQIENTKLEKQILQGANHPFLVGLDYLFQTPGRIYFVMKFLKGGELFMHLSKERKFKETRVKFYAAQIALALGHLHKNKIIYRDIKPENILMDDNGYICLADFGLAKILEGDEPAMSFCGTPEYLAPEIITGEGHNKAVDWWSLGILIYEMLVGIPPFFHKNQHVMYQYITTKSIIFPDPKKYKISISEEAKDVINQLLAKDQKDRLGSKGDLDEVIAHPWFHSIDIEKLLQKEIEPEYKPPITGKYDLQHFDPAFTSAETGASLIPNSKMEIIQKFEEDFKEFE